MSVLNFQWICCSMIAAASKRPMPLRILMRLDRAKISLFLASHKCRMASVGLGLVAKKSHTDAHLVFQLKAFDHILRKWESQLTLTTKVHIKITF